MTDREIVKALIQKTNQKIIDEGSTFIDIENPWGVEPVGFTFDKNDNLIEIFGY